MSNMSYCRFINTFEDLKDCEEHLDDDMDDKPDREIKARQKLIELCKRIAGNYA